MTDAAKHELLMQEFTPAEGYVIDEYYGVTLLTIRKSGDVSMQLQYDYKKRAVTSSSLMVNGTEKAMEIYRILMKYAVSTTDKAKDLSYI
jgi:hypothetical protein